MSVAGQVGYIDNGPSWNIDTGAGVVYYNLVPATSVQPGRLPSIPSTPGVDGEWIANNSGSAWELTMWFLGILYCTVNPWTSQSGPSGVPGEIKVSATTKFTGGIAVCKTGTTWYSPTPDGTGPAPGGTIYLYYAYRDNNTGVHATSGPPIGPFSAGAVVAGSFGGTLWLCTFSVTVAAGPQFTGSVSVTGVGPNAGAGTSTQSGTNVMPGSNISIFVANVGVGAMCVSFASIPPPTL